MNLEDLWIGDSVRLKKSGRVGKFIGVDHNKARIQLKDKTVLTSAGNLELISEESFKNYVEETKEEKIHVPNYYQRKLDFNTKIDLHIEKLQSQKQHENPVAILEFQLRKLKEFLDEAVDLRVDKVEIIHGIGTGALKMETFHLLDDYPQKVSTYPINNGGGVIVYFRYSA